MNASSSDIDRLRGAEPSLVDLSGLLLELARAHRGFVYFGEADARREPLARRAHLMISNDLERTGAVLLVLSTSGSGFDTPAPLDTDIARGPIADFESSLRRHGIESLRFDPALTATAVTGLLDLISRPADAFDGPESLARSLAARDSRGIRVNEIDHERTKQAPKLSATPLRASASLADSTRVTTSPSKPNVEDATTIDHDGAKPRLEEAPLAAPANDDRGERLRARLIELDATTDEAAYCARVDDIVLWAEDLAHREQWDDCYRAMLVLADHEIGRGGRSEEQARAAAAAFRHLASGDRLANLIDRATGQGITGVRAAGLLLQLGESAVSSILEKLVHEPDEARSAGLRSLILIQGDKALDVLLASIRGHDVRRARLGIRLAGEMQNPIVLPALIESLRIPDLSRRLETIRALSMLPGEESTRALTTALTSDLEEIASAAGTALATADGHDAVPVLLDVLDASVHSTRTKLACTLVEVLGRLGDERAVPRLCAILERRPMIRRAHWHSIQLVAIDAVSLLPSKEAGRCIQRAALHGAQSVRARARAALDRLAGDA